jgi:hypothetical protein
VRDRVPGQYLWVQVERGDHAEDRGGGRLLDQLVGVEHADRDRPVGVHLRRGLRRADRRSTGPDLHPHPGVHPGRDQRPGHPLALRVDPVSRAQQLVHRAVLDLREPTALHHHRVRAHAAQVQRITGGSCTAGRLAAGAARRAAAAAADQSQRRGHQQRNQPAAPWSQPSRRWSAVG